MVLHSTSKPRVVLAFALTLAALAFTWAADADDSLSLAPNIPLPYITIVGHRSVGMKKVGYQIRSAQMSSPADVTFVSWNEAMSLSFPFWNTPFVLSLQRHPSMLQP